MRQACLRDVVHRLKLASHKVQTWSEVRGISYMFFLGLERLFSSFNRRLFTFSKFLGRKTLHEIFKQVIIYYVMIIINY